MRAALTSAALIAALLYTAPVSARTRYPEVMANYDLSDAACKSGDRGACTKRDRYWRELRDAGYNLRQDPTNPTGHVWE